MTVAQNFRGSLRLPGPWVRDANCKNLAADLFFPERGQSIAEAKAVCRGCAVRQECLDFALDTGEKFGIWGGASERERRRLRAARKAGAA